MRTVAVELGWGRLLLGQSDWLSEALNAHIDERIERVPTEHDEMQWRLIRLGQLANVPRSIENIDVVWKFGPYSIRSAFEIEHSTSVYSGILRLLDLRAEAPNSNYPLFIVAPEDRKRKVLEELRRPTFSGPCLRLHEVIRFLGYGKIREIDEGTKNSKEFDSNILVAAGESVPLV